MKLQQEYDYKQELIDFLFNAVNEQGYKASQGGRANIFVCNDYKCQSPTADIDQALESLGAK